jgi:hypothetical protein
MILDLVTRWKWTVSLTLRSLYPGERAPGTQYIGDREDPKEPVWTLWSTEKYLAFARHQNLNGQPVANRCANRAIQADPGCLLVIRDKLSIYYRFLPNKHVGPVRSCRWACVFWIVYGYVDVRCIVTFRKNVGTCCRCVNEAEEACSYVNPTFIISIQWKKLKWCFIQ